VSGDRPLYVYSTVGLGRAKCGFYRPIKARRPIRAYISYISRTAGALGEVHVRRSQERRTWFSYSVAPNRRKSSSFKLPRRPGANWTIHWALVIACLAIDL